MQVQGAVLIMADEVYVPEIVARLGEFSVSGITIDRAYPLTNPGSHAKAIAFVSAHSQAVFDDFVKIIEGYAGITNCRGLPSTA